MKAAEAWLRARLRRWPGLHRRLRTVRNNLLTVIAGDATSLKELPADAFQADIAVAGPSPELRVGSVARLTTEVTNLSPRRWPGRFRVALAYHWRRPDGTTWAFDRGRVYLPRLRPGGTVRRTLTLMPPATPGRYVLELDLVYGTEWFGRRGSAPRRLELTVGGMQPDQVPEIDYRTAWAGADLARDHWSVVGAASAEEFRQLGEAKVEMLKGLGLQPASSVLDVGCGTGSLAAALEEFLGAGGLYFGTDISDEAVAFCRRRYARPQFRFATNAMTALPIEGLRFDFIVFFSVFTHTYPEETRRLLAEAARLLADRGSILADVFESDLAGDSLGTRAMVVNARRRLPDAAAASGLDGTPLFNMSWDAAPDRPIDRVLYRFTRRERAG